MASTAKTGRRALAALATSTLLSAGCATAPRPAPHKIEVVSKSQHRSKHVLRNYGLYSPKEIDYRLLHKGQHMMQSPALDSL